MTPLFAAVALLWFLSEITIGARVVRRVGARREDRFSGPALVLGMVLAVWLGAIVATRVRAAAISEASTEVVALGLVLALAGIGVRQYAVAALGRYFTTRVMTTPDQHVVETGPYRYVRHPSYTGLLMTVLGMVLLCANWLSVGCFVIALPGIAYRIQVEEQALSRALGDRYRDYMRRTKRLVPFVV